MSSLSTGPLRDLRTFGFSTRGLEGAPYLLLHFGAALGVDQRYCHVIEPLVDEIEPAMEDAPVLVRRHGQVLRLRHAALDFPARDERPDLAAALRPLKDACDVVPLGDRQADWPGKKEGARIHEVEGLAGLEAGELPIEIAALEDEILAVQRDLPPPRSASVGSCCFPASTGSRRNPSILPRHVAATGA